MEIGDIIAGRYRLEDLLGRGGMGAVYRAIHVGLAETVALKVVELPPGPSDAVAETFMKRFEREARVAFKLRHANAVGVLDYGESDGTPYLVMEYLAGAPLADEIVEGRGLSPTDRAIDIGVQLADVLVAMHETSLVHRDLKPENIILLDEEQGVRPVLVDFGLAYLADSETLGRVTQGGEVLGTPHYIAPEQGRGELEIGPAADVYALGCVLFEMFSGEVPFSEGSPSELVGKHMYVPAPSLAEVVGEQGASVPNRLSELVGRMLEKEAGSRPTADEVRSQLEGLRAGEVERPRGRPSRLLQERSERAVESTEASDAKSAAPERDVVVGVVGPIEEEWRLSLGSAGFETREVDAPEEARAVDVLFICEADVESVETYEGTAPILAGCDTSDFEASTALLKTAAIDVVPRPVEASKLVDKVRGVWRKVERRES